MAPTWKVVTLWNTTQPWKGMNDCYTNAMDESQHQCAGWRRSHEFCSQESKLTCSDRNQIGVTGSEMAQGDVKGITRGVKQPGEGWWICLLPWTWLWFSECDMCQNFGYFKYARRSVKRGRNILYYIFTSKWRSNLILPWRLCAWTIQENTWSGCLALSLIPVVFSETSELIHLLSNTGMWALWKQRLFSPLL